MRKWIQATAASALAMAAVPASAVPADFKAKADAILAAAYPGDGPGAVAVVYDHGKQVYASGRGLADIESGKRLTPDTPMRLGSITKQFTAAVVMQLVEEGKVGLDDPLSKFLPDFPAPGRDVTVRQLLNHTSGIQSYTGIPGLMHTAAKTRTTAEMIATFRDSPPVFATGTKWAYNNSGYVLLGAIIEKVTGMSWYDAIDRRISKRLNLHSLRYGGLPGGEAGAAKGYRVEDGKVLPALPIDMSFPHAAGGLVADANDLARWAEALHHGKVVKASSYAQMIAPTRLSDGTLEQYGFGLAPGEVRGHKTVGHDGGIFGFSTDSLYLTDEGIFIAVFANTERPKSDPQTISRRLAALAVGDPFESFTAVPLDEKAVAPFLGVYRSGEVERAFLIRRGKLYTQRKGNPPLEVLPAGGNRFFYPDSLTWFAIEQGADGKPAMNFHSEGAREAVTSTYAGPIPAEAPAMKLARAELEKLVGTYQGPAPIVVAIDDAGQLTLKLGSQPVTHLLAETPTTFRVEEVAAAIEFKVENGKASELAIKQGGRSLQAKRID